MAERLRYGRGHMCAGCKFENVPHGDCYQVGAQSAVLQREQRMTKARVESDAVEKLEVEKPPEN